MMLAIIKPRMMMLYGVLTVLLFGFSLVSLSVGPAPLTYLDIINVLLGHGQAVETIIVYELRLPRTLLAWLLGAGLGASGAALQGLLRNPLAEPGVLGISASAGLGAVLALYFGLAMTHPWLPVMMAMVGAALATGILYRLSLQGASTLTLTLTGVALTSLAGALTSLALNFTANPADVQDMVLWLLGSLANRGLMELQICSPFALVGLWLLLRSRSDLELLSLGIDEARTLGLNSRRLYGLIITGTALSVGACVAVVGPVGFVGLVVPHVLRRFVAYHPGHLIMPSIFGGAILVLAADTLLRLLPTAREPMLGVVTALLGAPFFLFLLWRLRYTL
jgi:iron complex transport system permease protein